MKIADFFFPPLCLHCKAFLEIKERCFCQGCASFLEPISPSKRCYYCFVESDSRVCKKCRERKSVTIPQGAIWENSGPVSTLIHKMDKEGSLPLIKIAASFLTIQLSRLHFPEPDLLVPIPDFWLYTLCRGPSFHILLAKELSRNLDTPWKKIVFTPSPGGNKFNIKRKVDLERKKILLLGTYLNREQRETLAQIFLERGVERICALTLI